MFHDKKIEDNDEDQNDGHGHGHGHGHAHGHRGDDDDDSHLMAANSLLMAKVVSSTSARVTWPCHHHQYHH